MHPDTVTLPEEGIFEREEPVLEYTAPGQRFVHFLVDMVLVYALVFVLAGTLAGLSPDFAYWAAGLDDDLGGKLLDRLITAALCIVLFTVVEGTTKGRTVGKWITRSRAVKEDGSPITVKDALVRSACRFIPFEAFSAFSGVPWHDRISKTVVVKVPRRALL